MLKYTNLIFLLLKKFLQNITEYMINQWCTYMYEYVYMYT